MGERPTRFTPKEELKELINEASPPMKGRSFPGRFGFFLASFIPARGGAEYSEARNKPSDLDLVTAIIYYSRIKKVTETTMLNFLEDKKKEGENPKFFKELCLPGTLKDFSDYLGSIGILCPCHDGFRVDEELKAKKGVSKRIKKVFDFKERLALKNLGNQFKKAIWKEQRK